MSEDSTAGSVEAQVRAIAGTDRTVAGLKTRVELLERLAEDPEEGATHIETVLEIVRPDLSGHTADIETLTRKVDLSIELQRASLDFFEVLADRTPDRTAQALPLLVRAAGRATVSEHRRRAAALSRELVAEKESRVRLIPVETMISSLRDADLRVTRDLSWLTPALARINPEARPQLVTTLIDVYGIDHPINAYHAKRRAIKIAEMTDADQFETIVIGLIKRLNADQKRLRGVAVDFLVEHKSRIPATLESDLIGLTSTPDHDLDVALGALQVLSAFPPAVQSEYAPQFGRRVITALDHAEREWRVVSALESKRTTAKDAWRALDVDIPQKKRPLLFRDLSDSDEQPPRRPPILDLCEQVSNLDQRPPPVVLGRILVTLTDDSKQIRRAATDTLDSSGLLDGDRAALTAVGQAISKCDCSPAAIIRLLTAEYKTPPPADWQPALTALVQLTGAEEHRVSSGAADAISHLLKGLDSADSNTVIHAIKRGLEGAETEMAVETFIGIEVVLEWLVPSDRDQLKEPLLAGLTHSDAEIQERTLATLTPLLATPECQFPQPLEDPFLRCLAGAEEAVRTAALEVLMTSFDGVSTEFRAAVFEKVLEALATSMDAVRETAIQVIIERPEKIPAQLDQSAVERLCWLLFTKRRSTRKQAAEALWHLAPTVESIPISAVCTAIENATDQYEGLIFETTDVLWQLAGTAPEATQRMVVQTLVTILIKSRIVRKHFIETGGDSIRTISDHHVSVVCTEVLALGGADAAPEQWCRTLAILYHLVPEEARPKLLEHIVAGATASNQAQRRASRRALEDLSSQIVPDEHPTLITELCRLSDTPDRKVCLTAVESFENAYTGTTVEVPERVQSAIRESMTDDNWSVREAAVRTNTAIATSEATLDSDHLNTVIQCGVSDDRSEVRVASLTALTNIETVGADIPAEILDEVVQSGITDETPTVRTAAVRAAAAVSERLPKETRDTVLTSSLQDPSADVRKSGVTALLTPSFAEPITTTLEPTIINYLLNDEDSSVQTAMIHALDDLLTAQALPREWQQTLSLAVCRLPDEQSEAPPRAATIVVLGRLLPVMDSTTRQTVLDMIVTTLDAQTLDKRNAARKALRIGASAIPADQYTKLVDIVWERTADADNTERDDCLRTLREIEETSPFDYPDPVVDAVLTELTMATFDRDPGPVTAIETYRSTADDQANQIEAVVAGLLDTVATVYVNRDAFRNIRGKNTGLYSPLSLLRRLLETHPDSVSDAVDLDLIETYLDHERAHAKRIAADILAVWYCHTDHVDMDLVDRHLVAAVVTDSQLDPATQATLLDVLAHIGSIPTMIDE